MPELPEVTTIIEVLTPIIKNRTITKIDVLRSSTIVGDKEEFVKTLVGNTYKCISRIGKYLIFHLTNDLVIISHLRMEGKYYEVNENDENTYFSRVVFHLDNGKKLCYDDSRCFGILMLSAEGEYLNTKEISKLGKEPFDIDDVTELYNKNKKSNHSIKTVITDQTMMAGIGNIYADEICFACKIHPETPARMITKNKWIEIIESAKEILNSAIKAGGSTIHSFHPGKGIDGKFQVSLKAYGKADEPCPNCGHPMRFIKVNGRGTTFCPICQPKISKRLTVAIFGPVASGKSTVAEIFKNKGFAVISADEIVHKLYKKKEVANKVQEIFNMPKEDEINIPLLRQYLHENPKEVKRLERLIHPLVARTIQLFFEKNDSKLLVAEVPLLYQAHMESGFDYIIGVRSNKSHQLLEARNKETANNIKKLNSYKTFDEGFKKADIVIENNGSLEELNKKVNQIINKLEDRLS